MLLRRIYYFFGVGGVYESENRAEYAVQSLRDITNVIIPHFDKYPLITQKQADYLLFKQAIHLLNLKAHFNNEGALEILNLRASLNKGLSMSILTQFPTISAVPRPIVSFNGIPHSD